MSGIFSRKEAEARVLAIQEKYGPEYETQANGELSLLEAAIFLKAERARNAVLSNAIWGAAFLEQKYKEKPPKPETGKYTDKERLDHLQKWSGTKWVGYDTELGDCSWPVFGPGRLGACDLREQIDLAMDAEKGDDFIERVGDRLFGEDPRAEA